MLAVHEFGYLLKPIVNRQSQLLGLSGSKLVPTSSAGQATILAFITFQAHSVSKEQADNGKLHLLLKLRIRLVLTTDMCISRNFLLQGPSRQVLG